MIETHEDRVTEIPVQKKQTLFDILADLEKADAGELSPEDAKIVLRKLVTKTDNVYRRIRDYEFIRDRQKKDGDELIKASKTADGRVKWLKGNVKLAMELTGQDRIEGDNYKYSLSKPKDTTKTVNKLVFADGVENNKFLLEEFSDGPMVNVTMSWNEDVILDTLEKCSDEERLSYLKLFDTKEVTTGKITRALRSGVISE